MVATHLITHGCFLLWIRRRINTLSLHMPQMLKVIRPKKYSVRLLPKNLVTTEKLKTLGVVKALKTSDNTPLAVMRTGQLRRNDGSLARGMQTANITVRSDAEYAINILGTVIHPGETKEIQLDLGTGENSTVPIFPAINGSTGQSNFIIEFPQLN